MHKARQRYIPSRAAKPLHAVKRSSNGREASYLVCGKVYTRVLTKGWYAFLQKLYGFMTKFRGAQLGVLLDRP